MRILFVGSKYDYGRPEQGYSFEYYNFYDCLLHMGHDVTFFDYSALMNKYGKNRMNKLLHETVEKNDYNLMFTVLLKNELDPDIIQKISDSDTITLNWFCDDHWRFDNYSKFWAPCFNWVVTTDHAALPKYRSIRYNNVIKSQWGCNHFLYKKMELPLKYDVTFVGYPHGTRKETIHNLRSSGIDVSVWGSGWELGRLSQDDMIKVFNQSRINLNLSNASVTLEIPGRLSRILTNIPFGMTIKRRGTQLLSLLRRTNQFDYPSQIKGRNFEVPGCGGLLLTEKVEGLEEYYIVGREVICFDGMNNLVEMIDYYLTHEEERLDIAYKGYQRTLHNHTYAHRFTDIFHRLQLPYKPLDEVLTGGVSLGQAKDVE